LSADIIVGVAPVDAAHVWVAIESRGSLSVQVWDGSSWSQPQSLTGVASHRDSAFGMRLVGSGQVWAYGPGILYRLAGGVWQNMSSKLGIDPTWGADGVLAVGGWGSEAYLTAQTSAYRWDGSALQGYGTGPAADVIFGASPTDAWAFGEKPFSAGNATIYRGNGGDWKLLAFGEAGDLYNPAGAYSGAASRTAGNVWALEDYAVMKQSGDRFTKTTPPSTDPQKLFKVVWTTSPSNTWVLGNGAFHWDGSAWTEAQTDLTGTFYGIGGSAPDVVWAYGATNGTWSLYRLAPN
jgi:hypothetical protein